MTRILRICGGKIIKKDFKKTKKTPIHHPQAKLEMTILIGKRRGTESRFY